MQAFYGQRSAKGTSIFSFNNQPLALNANSFADAEYVDIEVGLLEHMLVVNNLWRRTILPLGGHPRRRRRPRACRKSDCVRRNTHREKWAPINFSGLQA